MSAQSTFDNGGKLVENILYFSRSLRAAGMKLGPASVVDCVNAVEMGGISSRDDFYWILHSVLVKRKEDMPVFEEAFRLFWRSRELVEKMIQMFSPMMRSDKEKEKPKSAEKRVSEAMMAGKEAPQEDEKPQIEMDAFFSASEQEVLQDKDFAQMSVEEIGQARLVMSKLTLNQMRIKSRRYKASQRHDQLDPRKILSAAMRSGGDLILPRFRKKREEDPPIIILADISGSMSEYSRVFLQFFHALTETRRNVSTFLFGTRLSNVTRYLRKKDPDEAMDECAQAVEDWSGGTRIGETFVEFNRKWSRRVLQRGAIVLLITDGLEREEDDVLEHEIARLHRSCKKLIWLNPLLRFNQFQALARGIQIILPHVDEFRPVHSLNSLSALCAALNGETNKRENDPRHWLNQAKEAQA